MDKQKDKISEDIWSILTRHATFQDEGSGEGVWTIEDADMHDNTKNELIAYCFELVGINN